MAIDTLKYFRIEANDLLERLSARLGELKRGAANADTVQEVLRVAHTLKGAAHVVKQGAIVSAAHALEDLLSPYRGQQPPAEILDQALAVSDELAGQVATLSAAPSAPPAPPSAVEPGGAHPAAPIALGAPAAAISAGPSEEPVEEAIPTVRVETAELDRLIEALDEAAINIAGLRAQVAALEHPARLASAVATQLGRTSALPGPQAAGRLLHMGAQLRDELARIQHASEVEMDRLERKMADLAYSASHLRLVPVRVLQVALERAVRGDAKALGKRAQFQLEGGEHRLDAHMVAQLREALLHVVRNAVAHGIETPEVRRAAGKAETGKVVVRIERHGAGFILRCADDGAGIDVPALRRIAIERGILSASAGEQLTPEQLAAIVMEPGITTRGAATEIAGRGIGLDVLRDSVARLKGTVAVHTEAGAGTTVDIRIPSSLMSASVIKAEAGGQTLAFLADSVAFTTRVHAEDIVRTGSREALLWESRTVRLIRASSVLDHDRAVPDTPRVALIVRSGQEFAAVGVDRVHGYGEAVINPLPKFVAARPFVSGAALNPTGDPYLVLDPEAIAGGTGAAAPLTEVAPARAAPVLVIDDSVTTRMLEQSILESAGYDVHTASSAEEALERARKTDYSLFLVDVEMPGMDGFEFVEKTRSDPHLNKVPAILVTSRAGAADRERGMQAGASDYVVKSDFDQAYLLGRIRELVMAK